MSTRGNQDFNRLERRASGGHREGRTPQSSIRSRDAGLPQLQQKTRANGSRSTVSPPQSPVLTALWTTHIICPLDGVHSSHATRLYTPRHRERAAHRANLIWSVNHPPRVTCFPSPPRTPRPSREEHTLWHLLRGQRILCLALPSARGDSEWRDVHIPCARGGAPRDRGLLTLGSVLGGGRPAARRAARGLGLGDGAEEQPAGRGGARDASIGAELAWLGYGWGWGWG